MHLHVFQHVSFEGPGHIAHWAAQRGHTLSITRFDQSRLPEDMHDADGLIVMGGPMGVHDQAAYPWLKAELNAIRHLIDARRPILGICLGAQLIAHALGAPVTAQGFAEIGWFDIHRTEVSCHSGLFDRMPEHFTALHWHGDTFAIPEGAIHLAASQACPNQAFEIEGRILGLQFHLECNAQGLDQLIAHGRHELDGSRWVQHESDLRAGFAAATQTHLWMNALLDRLFSA